MFVQVSATPAVNTQNPTITYPLCGGCVRIGADLQLNWKMCASAAFILNLTANCLNISMTENICIRKVAESIRTEITRGFCPNLARPFYSATARLLDFDKNVLIVNLPQNVCDPYPKSLNDPSKRTPREEGRKLPDQPLYFGPRKALRRPVSRMRPGSSPIIPRTRAVPVPTTNESKNAHQLSIYPP